MGCWRTNTCRPRLYNPETDKVLVRYEPSDAMGHRFYGFAPLLAEKPDGYTGVDL